MRFRWRTCSGRWSLTTCLRLLLLFLSFCALCLLHYLKDFATDIIQHTAQFNANFFNSYLTNTEESMNQGSREGYLVWSPLCRIPDINPWHDSVRQLISRTEPVVCSSLPPLTQVNGRNLSIVQDNILLYAPDNHLKCCFRIVTRRDDAIFSKKMDNHYSLSECHDLQGSVTLTSEQQFVMVRCTAPRIWGDKEVYINFHATVPIQKHVKNKMELQNNITREKMSVLIVGIDSVSRLNLLRKMPKTVSHLRSSGWVEMRGYNKIDDNTFPNLMAILTGYNYTMVRKTCLEKLMNPIDSCPFIWKNYSRQGYITGYGEDEPAWATFNFQKAGFFRTPTDYYLRPFMVAAETHTDVRKTDGMTACLGPTLATDHVFKYADEFATKFQHHLSFSIFWMNTLSHNSVNTASAMDMQAFRFLNSLSKNKVLNNTLVLFLSDHGTRFGKIRQTYVGWLEERLPFLFIWVPEWYRKVHPQKYSNLLDNKDKLTSPFDLHLTLQEVLSGEHQKGTLSCPRCVSMFHKVPWNRACSDVGVTEHWCTCSEYRELSTEAEPVQVMVQFAVAEVNAMLERGKAFTMDNTICATLTVKRVLTVRTKVSGSVTNYIVLFETLPGQALLEATVGYSERFELLGSISRINAFGSQSKCMKDPFLKKYCFCIKVNNN